MRPDVIGFDLDMTLVDSADGIAATVRAALAEQGVQIASRADLAADRTSAGADDRSGSRRRPTCRPPSAAIASSTSSSVCR